MPIASLVPSKAKFTRLMRFGGCLAAGGLLLGLMACGDDLTEARIKKGIDKDLSEYGETEKCMNRVKIKNYKNNKYDVEISADDFPVVFAEEAYVHWSSDDSLIISLLLGEEYIAAHKGGYERSMREPGRPGALYRPSSYDEVQKVFSDIQQRGALIELTDKGRRANIWNDNFCIIGRWEVKAINNWTQPAPDSEGKVVSHVNATLKYNPTRIGNNKINNNYGASLETAVEPTFRKYADGWKVEPFGFE